MQLFQWIKNIFSSQAPRRRRGDFTDAYTGMRYPSSSAAGHKGVVSQDPITVSIFGASGNSGRAITELLIATGSLSAADTLRLISRSTESQSAMRAHINDLKNCFAGLVAIPKLEILLEDSGDCRGDIVIMAAGYTTKTMGLKSFSRHELGRFNFPVFSRYVDLINSWNILPKHLIVVSNPTELAVKVFQEGLPGVNVVGMGAHSDSIRLSQELANSFHVEPAKVKAMVGGEHGDMVVPLWTTVQIESEQPIDLSSLHWLNYKTCRRLRQMYDAQGTTESDVDLDECIKKHKATFKALIDHKSVDDVYTILERMPPDLKMALRPMVTCTSGSTTSLGTARACLEVFHALRRDTATIMSLQVYGLNPFTMTTTSIGVPVELSSSGYRFLSGIQLSAEEISYLRSVAKKVDALILDAEQQANVSQDAV